MPTKFVRSASGLEDLFGCLIHQHELWTVEDLQLVDS